MNPMYIIRWIVLLLLSVSVLNAEYADYGYNNGNNAVAHKTMTAKEVIIQNRKTITSLKRRVTNLEERVDGLTSLIEGLNATIAELRVAKETTPSTGNKSDTALLKELGAMIDKINNSYVNKEELQQALKGINTTASKSKATSLQSKDVTQNISPAKLYSEGVRLFVKKRYSEAKKRFTTTDAKGYKPAASNYYLGEISYYTKKYEDAIFYFKKSAGLYDQASYIDVLLLHTAISLDKTGDKSQAKTFYKNIIENYKGKNSARIAKDRLKKL